MSHIAEVYAKDLGVKVGKPQIQDHFFPVTYDKYITFHADTEIQSKQYDYWDICLFLIKPKLEEFGYKIIQVGGPKAEPVNGVDQVLTACSYRQSNYIIKNSKLHLGIDSLPVHVASTYDKPIVALYSHTYKETCSPYWSDPNKVELISPDFSKIKPSFATQELQKRINEIKPEVVAQAVLDKLGIDHKIDFKTVRAGKNFVFPIVEIKPDFFAYSRELHNKGINIRSDLHFDFNNILNWGRMCPANLILDRHLDDEQLWQIKRCVKQIIFKLDDLEKDYLEFFKKIKKLKINLIISTKTKDILSDLRLKYFDFNVTLESETEDISEIISEKTRYLSKKQFITKQSVYKSHFSAILLDNSDKFVLNDDSKQELESLYLYE